MNNADQQSNPNDKASSSRNATVFFLIVNDLSPRDERNMEDVFKSIISDINVHPRAKGKLDTDVLIFCD